MAYVLLMGIAVHETNASGWNDYELQIDSDYTIFRANSMDVGIGDNNGLLILVPLDYAGVGPIIGYKVTPTHIFTHHAGSRPRNLFQGDTFLEIDSTQNHYFVVEKGTDQITGPLALNAFQAHPVVSAHGQFQWNIPRNPNVVLPLFGNVVFVLLVMGMWGIPMVLLLILLLLIGFILKRRLAAA